MKLNKYLYIIASLLFTSCEYDYDMDPVEFTPHVVVSSVINPDSTIKVFLVWSMHIDTISEDQNVETFTAILYEDDKMIVNKEGVDGVLLTDVYPKEGSQYRLEIDVPNYGLLSAETSIPFAPAIDIAYTATVESDYMYNHYFHFEVNKITVKNSTRSVMIRAFYFHKDEDIMFSDALYSTNPYYDQFNAISDVNSYLIAGKGSSIDHDLYIRIPYKNINYSLPLKFSIQDWGGSTEKVLLGYDDSGIPIYDYISVDPLYTAIEVIAPSDEYDKYCKSVYQQTALVNDYTQIFNTIFPINSNIKNGLGIFAGYSSSMYKTNLMYDEQD